MQHLNAAIAMRSHYSRRQATELLKQGKVAVNGQLAQIGDKIQDTDVITIDGEVLATQALVYLVFNKPVGYECSRQPQGSHPSVYELLPAQYHELQYAGRLDVQSRGLLIFTNDGQWIQELTHPSFEVEREYQVKLDLPLKKSHQQQIEMGVELEDGVSKLSLDGVGRNWRVTLSEGRKHQVRRTFAVLGYTVTDLRRTRHGRVELGSIKEGEYSILKKPL